MNKTAWLLIIALVPLSSYSKSMKGAFTKYKETLPTAAPAGVKESGGPAPEVVQATTEIHSSTDSICKQVEQKSIPLSELMNLLTVEQQSPQLDVRYDASARKLNISSPRMISNCADMLDWTYKTEQVGGQPTHAIEAKFKTSGKCEGTPAVCEYDIFVKKDGSVLPETKSFAPTLDGMMSCLEYSKVIIPDTAKPENKVVNKDAFYVKALNVKLPNVKTSGAVLFKSNGMNAEIDAQYGDYVLDNKCDHYEKILPEALTISSFEDQEAARIAKEAAEIKECGDYHRMTTFIGDNEQFKDQMESIRNKLIIDAAKKSAQKISDGDYTAEDLAVIADFDKFIVQPQIEYANNIVAGMKEAKGDDLKQLQQKLLEAKKEMNALNSRPFFVNATMQKLIQDGKFDDAKKLHSLKVSLDVSSKLNTPVGKTTMTPDLANKTIVALKETFTKEIDLEQERYEIKSGNITGTADEFKTRMNNLRNSMLARNESYNKELASEQARVTQPKGACYINSFTTQKCVTDSMLRISQLQSEMKDDNVKAAAEMAKLEAAQKEYAELERQGRVNRAAASGEEVKEADKKAAEPTASRVQTEQGGQNNQTMMMYQAQIAQLQQQMAMMSQGQGQQQQSIFGQQQQMFPQQQQQNFMGQSNFGFQANAGYQMNMNNGYQQQMMPNYFQQQSPYGYQQQQGSAFSFAGSGAQNQFMPQTQQYQQYPMYGMTNQYNMYAR